MIEHHHAVHDLTKTNHQIMQRSTRYRIVLPKRHYALAAQAGAPGNPEGGAD